MRSHSADALSLDQMAARLAAAALLAVIAALAAPAVAETVYLKRRALPLTEGLELDFHTVQQRPQRDTYTSSVHVLSVDRGLRGEPGPVRFQWRIFEREKLKGQDEAGVITTTGLLAGRSYNPWWSNGTTEISGHTHVWLSQRACEELERAGQTTYALDLSHRSDKEMALRKVAEVSFEVRVDGAPVQMTAMELRSEKEDTLLVLADCAHPLVLEADIAGIYQWKLAEARTGSARRPRP